MKEIYLGWEHAGFYVGLMTAFGVMFLWYSISSYKASNHQAGWWALPGLLCLAWAIYSGAQFYYDRINPVNEEARISLSQAAQQDNLSDIEYFALYPGAIPQTATLHLSDKSDLLASRTPGGTWAIGCPAVGGKLVPLDQDPALAALYNTGGKCPAAYIPPGPRHAGSA